ncbi:MAG: aminotransferase class V-fold PLP-dependent enzyme [Pseudomonadota bacterium]
MTKRVYMDYAATTPVDPCVIEEMNRYLGPSDLFANPASSHWAGAEAKKAVEGARERIAHKLGAHPTEIVWTSGATESNNLALKGVAAYYQTKGRHIVTARTEHKAVLDSAQALQSEGFEVTFLTPDESGVVHPDQIKSVLRNDTILVSLMHVNNEIGVIQDIHAVADICRARGVLFHVDGAQSVGKLPIDLSRLPVDLLSFCAHKIYGPKGVGGLFVRRHPKVNLSPLQHGGGHEYGFRSGTVPSHLVTGFAHAVELAVDHMGVESTRIGTLKKRLYDGLRDTPRILLNGAVGTTVPNILNVSFAGVEGESLLHGLRNLAVSSGSACASASREPSYVLRALGRDDALAQASIRFSLGRFSTESEVDFASALVAEQVARLRDLAPECLISDI